MRLARHPRVHRGLIFVSITVSITVLRGLKDSCLDLPHHRNSPNRACSAGVAAKSRQTYALRRQSSHTLRSCVHVVKQVDPWPLLLGCM